MRIKSIQLNNFKRFTNLSIRDIPDTTKLVLLIGSNGSGKSSVFDAFEYISSGNVKIYKHTNLDYAKNKDKKLAIEIETIETGKEGINTSEEGGWKISGKLSWNSFYSRTSFRQIPRLSRTRLGENMKIEGDGDRAATFIDRDERFENDIEHIIGNLLKEFFKKDDNSTEVKNSVIIPINNALERIFNKENGTKLELVEIIPPLEGKTAEINFKKGNATFHYNYLSAGEKEVFNILINLVARREYYQNTIYFFDEIDLHLNTQLQYNFLKEIVENWIPENCQFWTASHSLGFIQYANDFENGVILDFADLDFDKPQIIVPSKKNDIEVFEIAVTKSFIDQVVQGRKIIFSENTDTPFYNNLNLPNTLFFVANDKMDVFHKAKNHKHFGLIDRDYLSDNEIADLKKTYPFLYILPYYSFENLLFHPNNLEEHYQSIHQPFNKQAYINQLVDLKNKEKDYILIGLIQARAGYPFYKENEQAVFLKKFKENINEIVDLLKSDNLEDFYKVFPAKDYGKSIPERQNLSINLLSKTDWFKTQLENILL